MKKLNLILVAVMLFSVGSVFANSGLEEESPKGLTQQINELLTRNVPLSLMEEDMSAVVYFTVNTEKEIVVLSVMTNEEALDAYIKSRLNYEKVKCTELEIGETYKIPVEVKS
ncbi:MAG: hypothetical protein R3299_05445 [Arenibacter sp.]|uniref:hypothetical protein n=1 Tax=Arenibacter TaxID=178469 RepID=UPI000A394BB6|nr:MULTISPECIES: hypothetical protein [Arenibacter]MDX1327130.1 hypothetical protein [Arenibacter sp.]